MSHEENLFDLYAGMAMLAMIMRGAPRESVAENAFGFAEDMIEARRQHGEEGIAAIHKPKRKYERKT